MLDAFFDGYGLSFVIQTPQPMKSNTLGTLSDDKKVLTYKTTIKDIVQSKGDVVLGVSW
jgi:hypothetical protein